MKYLNEEHIRQSSFDWKETVDVIERAVQCIGSEDYAQPVKPYLRYKDRSNRIIAMPAYLGGAFNMAGIKWIASFPGNLQKGLPRAHSTVILNDADTGAPRAIINTPTLSAIRTASVSGVLIRQFLELERLPAYTVGIIGFGPIGRHHLQMCSTLLGDKLAAVYLYDLNGVDTSFIPAALSDKTVIADSWEEVYAQADIFITCTVSSSPYIDQQPKAGSLHLNVSLRDYTPAACAWFRDAIIVDDWDEVCRESTDIERFHQLEGLQKEETRSITDVVCRSGLSGYAKDQPILFNPMGMAVFDIAMATYFLSSLCSAGVDLD